MFLDEFKKENAKDYTVNDLNCRKYVRHTKGRNKNEKKLRRKARRKLKEKLKKENLHD